MTARATSSGTSRQEPASRPTTSFMAA
jgi:hypothetical protein